MSDPVDTLFQKIDGLIPANLRHQPGKITGLALRISRGGVYLSRRDIFGIPINFIDDDRTWMRNVLLSAFPNLDARAILSRSSESARRFNSVAHRLELAQGGAAKGHVIAIESLDFQGTVPRLNVQGSQLAATQPSEITRLVTYVTLKPAPPQRLIILSDFPLFDPILNKKIIPDEIIISYPISDDELKAVKSAKPPATFIPFFLIDKALKKTAHLRINCFDINKEILGEQVIEHFGKTMRGTVAAATTALERFGIEPTGKVSCIATDSLLHSAEARITDPHHAELARRSARGTKISMAVEFSTTLIDGKITLKPTKLEPFFSKSAGHLAQRLGLSMVGIATSLEKVVNRLPIK